jgi:hypothetical protein
MRAGCMILVYIHILTINLSIQIYVSTVSYACFSGRTLFAIVAAFIEGHNMKITGFSGAF